MPRRLPACDLFFSRFFVLFLFVKSHTGRSASTCPADQVAWWCGVSIDVYDTPGKGDDVDEWMDMIVQCSKCDRGGVDGKDYQQSVVVGQQLYQIVSVLIILYY